MADKSNISWTDATWNCIVGCSKVSDGCKFCYAETLALRWGWTPHEWAAPYAKENITLKPHKLNLPRTWKEPRMVFVNSLSDMFHEVVPDTFIAEMFGVMADCPQHTFQILTKRPERMRAWCTANIWTGFGTEKYRLPLANVWLGTSVENQRAADERIPHLLDTPAAIRFLSCEPLLGPVDLTSIRYRGVLHEVSPGVNLPFDVKINALTGASFDGWDTEPPSHYRIGWVIVGGESGSHLGKPEHADRWMCDEWATDVRDQCVAAGVPFFFKQQSGLRPGASPFIIEADGSHTEWHQFPQIGGAA